MTTADYALIVSIFSAALALASLGWNVWSKFIYPKARLKVTLNAIKIVGGSDEIDAERPRFVNLDITNFGPTEVTVNGVWIGFRKWWSPMVQHAMVNPIHDIRRPEIGVGPFGGGLPKKLLVGDNFSLYFPAKADAFVRDKDLIYVAVRDVFNRQHRVRKKDIRATRVDLNRQFPNQPYVNTNAEGN